MIPELNKTVEPQRVGDLVHALGVVAIPEFASGFELESLQEEFQRIEGENNAAIEDGPVNAGFLKIIQREKAALEVPATNGLFSQGWMADVTARFFHRSLGPVNPVIYATKEVPATEHVAQDLHFDVIPALKFLLYLKPTTAENGAFACIPGSLSFSRLQRARRGRRLSYRERSFSRQHPFHNDWAEPVEGGAGTLIVFTTELWHRAGVVRSGERWVMRGHNHYPKKIRLLAPGPRALVSR